MSTASMATSLGLSKVFILDKYFSELQKFWETEKRLQGKMRRKRRGIVSLLICMWSETGVSSSSRIEKSHKSLMNCSLFLLLLSRWSQYQEMPGHHGSLLFLRLSRAQSSCAHKLGKSFVGLCCDVSFLLFSPRLSP